MVERVGACAVEAQAQLAGAARDVRRGIAPGEQHARGSCGQRLVDETGRDPDHTGLGVHEASGLSEDVLRDPDGEAHADLPQQAQRSRMQGVELARRRRLDTRDHGTTTRKACGTMRHSIGSAPATSPSVCTSTSLPSSTVVITARLVRKYATFGWRM